MTRYTVYVTPDALRDIRALPGHVRQRVKRLVDGLADDAYPAQSRELDLPNDTSDQPTLTLRRVRLDKWRILYAVTEAEATIDVLAVRKRPPYDYGDLESLLENLT